MQLSYDIFKIDNVEMARVLTIIESNCPSALSRRSTQDEVLINLDALSASCFHEVNSFVCSCLLHHCGSSKKKKRPLTSSASEGKSEGGGGGGGQPVAKNSKKK